VGLIPAHTLFDLPHYGWQEDMLGNSKQPELRQMAQGQGQCVHLQVGRVRTTRAGGDHVRPIAGLAPCLSNPQPCSQTRLFILSFY
jgi:hypothetical protein